MVWICLVLIENIFFKPVLLCYIYYICIKEMWRFWHPQHEVLKSLYRYPVKSCLGEDLQRAQLVQEGILGDRSHVVTRPWAVVQQHMKCFCMSDFCIPQCHAVETWTQDLSPRSLWVVVRWRNVRHLTWACWRRGSTATPCKWQRSF